MRELRITNAQGQRFEYVLDRTNSQQPAIHTSTVPNVPLNVAMSTPAAAGGQYDVRDTEGDKAITHLDWSGGSGQESLDEGDASPNMFLSSENMRISRKGELSLLHSMTVTPFAGSTPKPCGPVFSMGGVLWMGYDGGRIAYSGNNGLTWSLCAVFPSGTAVSTPLKSVCTDGVRIYLAYDGGVAGVKGIFANTAGSPYVFTAFGTTPTVNQAFTHIAYQGGYLFAATAAGVGTVHPDTGVWTKVTPQFLNAANTTVALVAAANAVYWVVSQGGRSYVYEISYDPDSKTSNTEQFLELQSQFTATCAVGYLSTLYIGGYFQTVYDGVGRGGVYICATNQSYMAPLFELGPYPEDTPDPTAAENDNRVYAMCEAGRDLYVATQRNIYRWDIDDGGWSHVSDFPGMGGQERKIIWSTTSLLSWEGKDLTTGEHPNFYPDGWTTVTNKVPGDWVFTGTDQLGWQGKYNGIGQVWTAVPPTTGNADVVLNNTNGTTFEFKIPNDQAGAIDVDIKDGVRRARWSIAPTSVTLRQYAEATYIVTTYINHAAGYYQVWHNAYYTETGYYTQAHYEWQIVTPGYWTGGIREDDLEWHPDVYGNVWVQGSWGPGWIEAGYSNVYKAAWTETVKTVTPSGRWYWDDETVTVGDTKTAAALSATVPIEKTVLIKLIGNTASISTNGGTSWLLTTVKTKPDTATNAISITWKTGCSIDSIIINAAGGTTTSGATAFTPSIIRHKGALFGSYYKDVAGVGEVGQVQMSSLFSTTGELWQSPTTFHTGSILKDFREIVVSHDILPADTTISVDWIIDGRLGTAIGTTSGTTTKFKVATTGYSIKTCTRMTSATGISTPVVRGVNVVWNFLKGKKHVYILDCTEGAANGRWGKNPLEAVQFLFAAANQKAMFEDKYSGIYSGAIEDIKFIQAADSIVEGPGGSVQLTVREG